MVNVYTLWDKKGKFYSTPFFARNDDAASRDFSNVVMNEQNPMHRHPGDYVLYRIGSFHPDDTTDTLTAEQKPTLIIDGSDL